LGVVFGLMLPGVRRRIRRNLRRVLGRRGFWPEFRDTLATLANYASCFAESLARERIEAQAAAREVIEDAGVAKIIKQNRGLVLLTAHLGASEMAGGLMAAVYDASVLVAMQGERDSTARQFHDGVRISKGVRVVHVGAHPLDAMPLYEHLKEGGVVAIQFDRVPDGMRAETVTLFGEPFRVPSGPFALAGLAGVPVLSVFAQRRGLFDYLVHVGQLQEVQKGCKDFAVLAQKAASEMEAAIVRAPTQWFHFAQGEQEGTP
jgi:KDO2-lipid IV(A) lauroyltransferase